VAFEADGVNFHHALATLQVALPESSRTLKLISAHLCPNGPNVRRREAAYLAVHAASYEVIRTPLTDRASDHYPVLAIFEIPQ